MNFYEVAVNTPFNDSLLTYQSIQTFKKGDLVSVPLGRRLAKGCILGAVSAPTDNQIEIKEIKEALEGFEPLSESFLDFLLWVSRYYHYPAGQHIFDILPKPMKRPRLIDLIQGQGKELPFDLNHDQKNSFDCIKKSLGSFKKFLLHGVTGSGKTSVYLKVFQEIGRKNGNGVFLVPEINLTPQFIKTFQEHIEGSILTYHSSMSSSEKKRVWDFIANDEGPYLLIGVRSSIFLPFRNLDAIVIDEEHDSSYKQEDRCPYHMRDVALKLASAKTCPVILGSATPTIETYKALKNSDGYLALPKRVKDLALPEIEVVDSRKGSKAKGHYDEDIWPFTQYSISEIKARIDNSEQVLVFVNRLGFANFVQCGSCGKEFDCLNCYSNLKYFKKSHSLNCQVCGFSMAYPDHCPDCGNMKLLQKGFGTERLVEVLQSQFPTTSIERFDRDAVKNFNDLKDVLERFHSRKTQMLVGTQMLSKGHNFPGVNLVVLLGVDSQLNFPDFRGNEKVFQLITQTAGRPGRSEKKGKVLIESLSPENKIFNQIKNYANESFIAEELQVREALNFPPYSHLVALYFISRFQKDSAEAAQSAGGELERLVNQHFPLVDILGPRPGIMEKRANKFNWTILLRSQERGQLHNLLRTFRSHYKFKSGVSFKVDVDPQSLA